MRGISPLVATFLLIAFTLVVAGVLAGWATNLAQQQRAEAELCAAAKFMIKGATYDSGTSTLSILIDNWGTVDLNISANLIFADGNVRPETFYVPRQSVKSFQLSDVASNLNEISMRSIRCPMVYDSMKRDFIVGLGA
ncbi:MAG: archaellin/type IV pilin N-terminal domain-containing protein [Candidatus Aenigmatarchaeota archaeon]